MRSRTGQKGFTLIELLVVIAVIAILVVALGAYWLSNRPHYRLMSAARDLASDMRKAKSLATNRSLQTRINFTPVAVDEPPGCAGPTYVVQLGNLQTGSTVWTTVGNPALELPSICRRFGAVEEYNGVALAVAYNPAPTQPAPVFQTNGTVTDNGSSNILTAVTITLTQTQGANCPPCETSTVTLTGGGAVTVTP